MTTLAFGQLKKKNENNKFKAIKKLCCNVRSCNGCSSLIDQPNFFSVYKKRVRQMQALWRLFRNIQMIQTRLVCSGTVMYLEANLAVIGSGTFKS